MECTGRQIVSLLLNDFGFVQIFIDLGHHEYRENRQKNVTAGLNSDLKVSGSADVWGWEWYPS
jgi:hypothetical protein